MRKIKLHNLPESPCSVELLFSDLVFKICIHRPSFEALDSNQRLYNMSIMNQAVRITVTLWLTSLFGRNFDLHVGL